MRKRRPGASHDLPSRFLREVLHPRDPVADQLYKSPLPRRPSGSASGLLPSNPELCTIPHTFNAAAITTTVKVDGPECVLDSKLEEHRAVE